MSTPAQIAANIANGPNIANAQASTGPRSEAGKATSSQNGVKLGLFTAGDFVRPCDQPPYDQLKAELNRELAPAGILELNLVDEIRRAMWRLRRCGEVESHLAIFLHEGKGFIFDPMETSNADAEKVQKSVDRARAQAHRLLHKCTAELRRLQTERPCAQALFPDAVDLGIADTRAVAKSQSWRMRAEPVQPPKLSVVPKPAHDANDVTMRTQSGAPQAPGHVLSA